MEWPDLVRFLWRVTQVFLNVSDRILFFFSEELNFFGTTFTRFDLIFGVGLISYLGYAITKWLLPTS